MCDSSFLFLSIFSFCVQMFAFFTIVLRAVKQTRIRRILVFLRARNISYSTCVSLNVYFRSRKIVQKHGDSSNSRDITKCTMHLFLRANRETISGISSQERETRRDGVEEEKKKKQKESIKDVIGINVIVARKLIQLQHGRFPVVVIVHLLMRLF